MSSTNLATVVAVIVVCSIQSALLIAAPEGPAEKENSIQKSGEAKTDAKKLELEGPLEVLRTKRRTELDAKVKEIELAKSAIKTFMIADDKKSIESQKQKVAGLQRELTGLLESPLSNKTLNLEVLEKGQVGLFAIPGWDVLQILDKEMGSVLITRQDGPVQLMKLESVDVTNLIPHEPIRTAKSWVFYCTGNYSYQSKGRGELTVFSLRVVDTRKCFSETEMAKYRKATDPDYKVVLSAEEETKARVAREANMKAEAEIAKNERAKQDIAKAESRVRRAKSYLDSAKKLLDKDQRAGAKKYLEKAIADDPESETGKEAKKLLDRLP